MIMVIDLGPCSIIDILTYLHKYHGMKYILYFINPFYKKHKDPNRQNPDNFKNHTKDRIQMI